MVTGQGQEVAGLTSILNQGQFSSYFSVQRLIFIP